MKDKFKRNLLNVIGILFSVFFIALLYNTVDTEKLKEALTLPNPWVLLWIPFFDLIILVVRGIRWKVLLNSFIKVSLWDVFALHSIGAMGNNVAPLKAGEALRAAFLAKKTKLPFNKVLSSLGIEHIFDGIGLFIIAMAVYFTMEVPLWYKTAVWVLSAVVLVSLFIVFIIRALKLDIEKFKHKHPVIYYPLEFFYHIGDLGNIFKSPKQVILSTVFTLVIWATMAYSLVFIHQAFDIAITFHQTFFILIAFVLATALPSAPASIGPFEYACTQAYLFLGLSAEKGLSLGFYYHMMQVIPMTLVGLYFYFRWSHKFNVDFKSAREM